MTDDRSRLSEDEKMAADERTVRRDFRAKLRDVIGRIPFARDAVAAYFAALDPATPKHVKAVLLAALAYFILPLDTIPDFLVGLGFTDDAAVLFAAMRTLAPHIGDEHRRKAEAWLAREHPTAE